ncbi:hypothetical protein LCGC14_2458740 [marine sediment metagenome]|uniref:Uncharacterized protein n=1 Tax=marine sediment metagenome TaxID=412755 RepID=A0A0F9BEE8_9ZZZZ
MKKIDRMYVNAFTKRRWRNVGDFCNRERHPMFFPYRRYRRGKNRCDYCGAKIGKIKCVYEIKHLIRDFDKEEDAEQLATDIIKAEK